MYRLYGVKPVQCSENVYVNRGGINIVCLLKYCLVLFTYNFVSFPTCVSCPSPPLSPASQDPIGEEEQPDIEEEDMAMEVT